MAVVSLSGNHHLAAFDCGNADLNTFLKRYALQSQQGDFSCTFVTCRQDNHVIGFYTLAMGSVKHADATIRMKKGASQHDIPVVLLARFAVCESARRQKIGGALLKDAMLNVMDVSKKVGVRAMLAHAKDEEAKSFYKYFGFEPGPTDDLHMFLVMKDIRKNSRG